MWQGVNDNIAHTKMVNCAYQIIVLYLLISCYYRNYITVIAICMYVRRERNIHTYLTVKIIV